jgi:chemotaxis protein methyltransferase CheR
VEGDDMLKFFAKYIESELGIVYAEHNYFQLENRLEEIAKLVGVPCIQSLYEQAKSGISGQFKQMLLDVATNNETSFFRDPKVFKAIENTILKSVSSFLSPGEKLRIWSAASSTGQEALSLTMMIKEFNLREKQNIGFSILASDISERVLARAKGGSYTQLEVQRGMPAPYLIKYFKKDDEDKWTASSELLAHIDFKKINLKGDFGIREQFHFVLCRNILIYQNVEGKIDIINRIAKVLAPGGYLVLGAGESLLGLSTDFEQCLVEGSILYRKKK